MSTLPRLDSVPPPCRLRSSGPRTPSAGRAEVDGLDVVADAEELRYRIGLAGQSAAVDENLTGLENLELVGRLYGLDKAEARRRSGETLDRFELSEAAH